jgi:hypothetical protein
MRWISAILGSAFVFVFSTNLLWLLLAPFSDVSNPHFYAILFIACVVFSVIPAAICFIGILRWFNKRAARPCMNTASSKT